MRPSRQVRARYARTNGNFLVNSPDGFPSGQDPVTLWWVGDDSPIVTPTAPGAGLAAVTRATSLICDTISALPWRYLSGGQDPQTSIMEFPSPRWIQDPQLDRSDARFGPPTIPAAVRLPRAGFWAQWMRSALLRGMGYLIFEEDFGGGPIAGTLRLLNPDAVAPVQSPDGFVHRRIGPAGGDGIETDFDGRFAVGPRPYRLVELRNPTGWVDEYGLTKGVLEMHAVELGLALQALTYGTGAYRSGVPAGILKTSVPNFNKEQADALRARWMEHHGGDRKSIAVLNATTDFMPLPNASPVDLELINSRKMSLLDIANAFGVPAYMIGGSDGGSNTYSNAESRNRDFLSFSLLPWANAVEDVLSSLVPQGQYLEVAFSGLLKPDTATRYKAYSMALRDGWLSVDEVRLLESLPPMQPARPFGGPPQMDPGLPLSEIGSADAAR